MNIIIKQVVKIVLPILVNWLVKKAEDKITQAKSGDSKKAYVIETVEDILKANNLQDSLNKEKLSGLIDNTVSKLINKL
ncbi:hypothetical protein EOM09_03615 [bacterium]|nr:hypothetical protein [bacterium]